MKSYTVIIQETMYHSLTVEANSEDEAAEMAYDLLSYVPKDELRKSHDYEVDGEFNGDYEVEENQ